MSQKTVIIDGFTHQDLQELKKEFKKKNFTETIQILIKEHKAKKNTSNKKKRKN